MSMSMGGMIPDEPKIPGSNLTEEQLRENISRFSNIKREEEAVSNPEEIAALKAEIAKAKEVEGNRKYLIANREPVVNNPEERKLTKERIKELEKYFGPDDSTSTRH